MKKKVYLTLQNGKTFQGYGFGADGDRTGELVFSTGMVGYLEALTDPSYYGRILLQTFPLIGNYGVIRSDLESDKAQVAAYVVREYCEAPSNFRCEGTLDAYLKEQGVVGIYGVDTRELTKILREEGVQNAMITKKPLTEAQLRALGDFKVENAVQAVAPTEKKEYTTENAAYTVALWNFGAKNSTIRNLLAQGCNVISMPANAKAEEILALGVDGVVCSDGPSDPAENIEIISQIKRVLGKLPTFGIGLGHELIALACGAKTRKQKYGHRGGNQPVRCVADGKIFVSAQNHGYEVVSESVTQGEISFVNVNDGSCEGIDYAALNAFSVSFTPEACSIGVPENPLYKKFFTMMKKEKENA